MDRFRAAKNRLKDLKRNRKTKKHIETAIKLEKSQEGKRKIGATGGERGSDKFTSALDLEGNVVCGKEATLGVWRDAYEELGNDRGGGGI